MEAQTRHKASSQLTPFTGGEYLESLRDSREVWIYGERVKDVTKHPRFATALGRWLASTMLFTTRNTVTS